MTDAPQPFLILAMPRSMTKWLSVFLTQGPWVCHHDMGAEIADLDTIASALAIPYSGTIETGGDPMQLATVFKARFPEGKIAVITRAPCDVVGSLMRFGLAPDSLKTLDEMNQRLASLHQVCRQFSVFSIRSEEIPANHYYTSWLARRLFGENLKARYDALIQQNIQIDMPQRIALLERNSVKIDELKKSLSRAADLAPVTILAEEPTDAVIAEARALAEMHFRAVGDTDAGREFDPDLESIVQAIQAKQAVHLVARHKGVMVGYLAFFFSRSIQFRNLTIAMQSGWFCHPDHPGVGMKMMHEMKHRLTEMGISEMWPHYRPTNKRQDVILDRAMRRLGGKPVEKSYLIQLR